MPSPQQRSNAAVFALVSQIVHDLDAARLVTVQTTRGTGRGHYREGVAVAVSLR